MSRLKVVIPNPVYIPRKTKKDKPISLSMNWYRNAHHHVSNEVKGIVKEEVKKYLEETGQDKIKLKGKVKVTYHVWGVLRE